ncbi:hypothetical protein HU200_038761 [Digitaria exilis]|uniref:Uncharacterized protein n=1 Tax=Digitaria exilis TaxID=1010633 RepID=A0A835BB63_9POAL|nr:hypothetical protein HU200_038761 [Digitaria exilis]CAB3449987.1 unnamed protein product [Digitaria exilis]
MGACATKPGDLKVKGEAPLVVEDAAATLVSCEEKAKADVIVPAAAAAEADPADAGRRRSLSDLLKQEAETSDGEAEKVVTVEPATGAAVEDEAGAKLGAQAPVQAVVETEHNGGAADQPRDDPNGGDVQVVVEEEKRVDPDSVQVAVSAADADAAPSADETENADDASA